MKLEGAFLRSRFGQRLFIMFGLAVIIPAAVVFFLTYRNAARLASADEATTLRVFNKAFALAVFERLQMARSTLERASGAAATATGPADGPMFAEVFAEVMELEAATDGGRAGLPSHSSSRLLILRQGDGPPRIAILATQEHAGLARRRQAIIDPGFLWGDADAALADGRICVSTGNVALTCVGESRLDSTRPLLRDQWNLVLQPEFGAATWHFVAEKPSRGSFASYSGMILPLSVGMLLLALLLSSIEIRRILVPLEALLGRIASIGGGPAPDVRADDDEFLTLDRTFQSMESRISRQILMLETLQRIDQLILARVPLAEVVELVLERVSAIVGPRPIAISLFSPAADMPTRHFRRWPQGSLVASDDGDPVGDGSVAVRRQAHGWQLAAAIGPGLQEFQPVAVWCLTVGQDSGPWVRLCLGQLPTEAGQALPGAYDEHGELGELAGRVAVALAAEAHEKRLVHQARHDLLTDLPNRLAVFEMLPGIIRQAQQTSRGFATLFVDLDRFKAINDGLGHQLGDSVLIEVARRIRRAVGPDSLVARLGGDEFLVIAPRAGDRDAALSIDADIRQALKQAVVVEGNSLLIDFTAGIALYPTDGDDPEQLMHNADLAMYRAKRLGGGSAALFDAQMSQLATRRVQMENELRCAVDQGQLHLHYQPRIDSRDGSIVAAEALVRWRHPTAGDVGPADFIGLAEECGLIGAIGNFVIDSACQQMARWRAAGLELPLIAINVSPHQLRAGDLFQILADALATHGIDWRQLEIEITEAVLITDSVCAKEQLQRLRDAGCSVAIDDFGTGYSSLAYLANLPTDTIKLDRSFMSTVHTPGTQAVVRSIIALGQALGKTIVAEGLERPEEVKLLNSWGCHIVQGYVYFPPLAPEALAQLLGPAPR